MRIVLTAEIFMLPIRDKIVEMTTRKSMMFQPFLKYVLASRRNPIAITFNKNSVKNIAAKTNSK